jgi:hypothetical protein
VRVRLITAAGLVALLALTTAAQADQYVRGVAGSVV